MPQAIDCEILTIEDEVGNILEKASAGENCRFQIEEKIFEEVKDGAVLSDFKHRSESVKNFVVKMFCSDAPSVLTAGF